MNYKKNSELNFFEPKIKLDDNNFIGILKNSIKIYIVIFIITIIYISFKTSSINGRYDALLNEITQIKELDIKEYDLTYTEIENRNKEIKLFLKEDKILSQIIQYIDENKPQSVVIKSLFMVNDSLKIGLTSKNENDAINFIKVLRKNQIIKKVIYTGGKVLNLKDIFAFDIEAII